MVETVFNRLENIENLHILAPEHKNRLGVISFYIEDLHFNLGVKLLNDHFGIQTRGGCSCAGTYGHYLLHVDQATSADIISQITIGDLVKKPGWIRMSIHPTTTTQEINQVCDAIIALAKEHKNWAKEYTYNAKSNEFIHANENTFTKDLVASWFEL